jgi:hypothetical protein
MLVSVATEYNNALLVVENANIGWDVVNTVIEKGYEKMYYSPRAYGDMSMDKWLTKMEQEQTVPGFTTSAKTRPLVISKMESYIREKAFIFHSKRLLEELRVFIWMNGKAQSQNGYNDDLVMSWATGLFLRDTAFRFRKQAVDLAYASLNSFSKSTNDGFQVYNGGGYNNYGEDNPWTMQTRNGEQSDITWLL